MCQSLINILFTLPGHLERVTFGCIRQRANIVRLTMNLMLEAQLDQRARVIVRPAVIIDQPAWSHFVTQTFLGSVRRPSLI